MLHTRPSFNSIDFQVCAIMFDRTEWRKDRWPQKTIESHWNTKTLASHVSWSIRFKVSSLQNLFKHPQKVSKNHQTSKNPKQIVKLCQVFLGNMPKNWTIQAIYFFWHGSHGMKPLKRNMIMMASLNTVCEMHEHFDGCARLISWKKQNLSVQQSRTEMFDLLKTKVVKCPYSMES